VEKAINKTDHSVTVLDEKGKGITTFPSKGEIRINEETLFVKEIGRGVKIVETVFTPKDELPKKIKGIYYIVSSKVKKAFPERDDFLVPSCIVRDNNRRVIGCRFLNKSV